MKLRKRLWLVASLLVMVALLVGGCAAPSAEPVPNPQPAPASEVLPAEHPKGMKSLRLLADEEKVKVVEIALKTPEAVKAQTEYGYNETKLRWIAIVWKNSEYSEWWGLNYDWSTDPNFSLVPGAAEYYSEVVINFGQPPQWQVYVAVNPDTGQAVTVMENPYRTGPTPVPTPPSTIVPAELPEGMKSLRWLTEEEKAKVIEIALNTPEAKEARERYSIYKTGLRWVAIMKNESGGLSLWGFDYEMVENVPETIPEEAAFYSQAEILFGEPEQVLLRVAVNPDTGEVAHVEEHGLKILPK